MGTRYQTALLSGIVRHDPRLTLTAAESGVFDAAGAKEMDLGEESPVPAIPVRTAATDLALWCSGGVERELDVWCGRPGLPVLDGFGYLCRESGGTSDDLMGCDLPNALGHTDSITTAARYTPHVIALAWGESVSWYGSDPDQPVLAVCAGVAGAIYAYTALGEVTIDLAAVTDPYPCLLRLPTGRVICYRWEDSGTDHQVRAWYSDDAGLTWTESGPVLLEPLDGSAGGYPDRRRLRAVYCESDGTIALFAHVLAADTGTGIWRDRVAQWASSDGGWTFTLVTVSDGSDEEHAGSWIDVCMWRGEIVLARLITSSALATSTIRIRRLPSAWYPWTSGEELADLGGLGTWAQSLAVQAGGGAADYYYSEGELALWADDDGALYATARHCSGARDGACPIMRSADGGKTWTTTGSSLLYGGRGQAWHYTGGGTTEAYSLTACAAGARSVVVHALRGAHATADLLYATEIGGWTSSPMPSVSEVVSTTRRTGWAHTGSAGQRPDEAGWTRTAAGGVVETMSAGYIEHDTTAGGSSINYTVTPPGTQAEGILAEFSVQAITTGCRIEVLLQSAVPTSYHLQVRVTPAEVRAYDVITGLTIGTPLAHSGGLVNVRISMYGDTVAVEAHTDQTGTQARPFVEIVRLSGLANGGGAAANQILFAPLAGAVVRWYSWCYTSDAYCGDHLYSQPPRQKMPRSLCESPSSAIYGARLSSVSGPGTLGDYWTIGIDAQYGYERMTADPCPRHGWRDTAFPALLLPGVAGPTGRLTWRLGPVVQSSRGPAIGIWLDGLTMGGVQVWLDYGGSYHLAASAGYLDCYCTIIGDDLVVSASGSANAVLRRDELAGCFLEVLDNAATTSQEQLIVAENDPGRTDVTAGTSVPLRITCTTTPVSAGVVRVRVYPRRCLMVIDLAAHSQSIRGVQVRWPIPRKPLITAMPIPGPSAYGYHGISSVVIGPLWAFGARYDWGRRLSTEPDTELLRAEDGTKIAYERGPVARVSRCSWSEGVPMHDYLPDETDPDYTTLGSAVPPLAARWLTPVDLADIVRALRGALTPILFCEDIDAAMLERPWQWGAEAYIGRITSAVDRDEVLGDSGHGPVERVQELVVEEDA